MARVLVAGVDSSTQSTKVVLVDPESGELVALGRASHTVSGHDGARESDPEQWWSALSTAFHQALDQARERTGAECAVSAVSVAGQQHGLVTLDADGRPVRPAILWNDVRSAEDAEKLTDDLGGAQAWTERTGTVPVASITATKWAWLRRNEPASASATAAVRLPHDFLTERLCGNGVTDRGDASGSGWYSTAQESYDPTILELPRLQLDPALLPRVAPHDVAAGEITREAAQHLGIAHGALVGAGTGDNMAAALGLGLESVPPAHETAATGGGSAHAAVFSLGTSGTVFTSTAQRAQDPTGMVAGFADASGGWLPLGCTLNCTQAVDTVASWLGRDREAVEEGGEVVMLPFFDGERTPNLPLASGLVSGLRHATTPGQILRAAYEGAVHSLLAALERIGPVTGTEIAADLPLLVTGGGAQGRAWVETIRRLSGRPVVLPRAGELVAVGAAAQAASLLSKESAPAVARRWGAADGPTLDPVTRDEATLRRLDLALERANPMLAPRS
ncbi:xylulokinase [Salinactinospora qingdaonensis]|uniref:Xylulose kinase n=1 Tax=Salinactinospora qingdaonensis TaxID=702744 RepID=A0ABP7FBM8_9ACTN